VPRRGVLILKEGRVLKWEVWGGVVIRAGLGLKYQGRRGPFVRVVSCVCGLGFGNSTGVRTKKKELGFLVREKKTKKHHRRHWGGRKDRKEYHFGYFGFGWGGGGHCGKESSTVGHCRGNSARGGGNKKASGIGGVRSGGLWYLEKMV